LIVYTKVHQAVLIVKGALQPHRTKLGRSCHWRATAAATASAMRVLLTPPGPVRVTRGMSSHCRSERTVAISCSRPISGLREWERVDTEANTLGAGWGGDRDWWEISDRRSIAHRGSLFLRHWCGRALEVAPEYLARRIG